MTTHEHNHVEGSFAYQGSCPRCDADYWLPRLARLTDPRPDWLVAVILTAALAAFILLVLLIAGWRP